ncbi:hypothetical protein ACJJTC_016274 [Scirpophaga incertulas]
MRTARRPSGATGNNKTAEPSPVDTYMKLNAMAWYFRKIKRIEAEKKLLLPENEHGAFLIRDSESRHNDFSLSAWIRVRRWSRRFDPGAIAKPVVRFSFLSTGVRVAWEQRAGSGFDIPH